MQAVQGQLQHLPVPLQRDAPAGDLLGEPQGHRVLEVGTPDLDDVVILRLQPPEGCSDPVQRGKEGLLQRQGGSDVQGGGEGVVGALGHVHVVVGMDLRSLGGHPGAEVGYHLVDVHVGLGAAAGLPDLQGELPVPLVVQYLVAGGGDPAAPVLVQTAQLPVGQGGRLFQQGEGTDDLLRHPLDADGKVLQAPLCLGAPAVLGGDLHGPQRVVLQTDGGFPNRHGHTSLAKWLIRASDKSTPNFHLCL